MYEEKRKIYLSGSAYADGDGAVLLSCFFKGDRKGDTGGIFAVDGYHMMDEEGNRSGYGYDILQLLGRYGNVVYEYRGYDKSGRDMLQMLEDGEIDLVTPAAKTPEREACFAFSEKSIGVYSTMITVKAGNESVVPQDYSTYDGLKVGLLQGTDHTAAFEEFAAEYGFSYSAQFYGSSKELYDALQTGEVDAAATCSLRAIQNEWIIDSFKEEPFYVMLRKEDTELFKMAGLCHYRDGPGGSGLEYASVKQVL